VIDRDTSAPVAGAQVILMPAGPIIAVTGPPPAGTTGEDGQFRFDAVAPGTYRLQVSRPGLAPVLNPFEQPAIVVTAGQTTRAADVPLQKGGAITGRVVDARGEPVPEMLVRLEPTTRSTPPLVSQPGRTNDIGEFRVAGVAPGSYYLVAAPQPSMPFASVPPTSPRGFIPTFYPAALEQSAAQPIDLSAGQTMSGLELTMQTGRLFRVSGIVVDEAGTPVADANVTAMRQPGSASVGPAAMARTGANGSFLLAGIQAGTYRLAAMRMRVVTSATSGGSIVSGLSFSTFDAATGAPPRFETITVTDADVTGVTVTAPAPRP
jgi:hypothetical protein